MNSPKRKDVKHILTDLGACDAAYRKLVRYKYDFKGAWKSIENPDWLFYTLQALTEDQCYFLSHQTQKQLNKIMKKLLSMKLPEHTRAKLTPLAENINKEYYPFCDASVELYTDLFRFFRYSGTAFPKKSRIELCNYIRKVIPFSEIAGALNVVFSPTDNSTKEM